MFKCVNFAFKVKEIKVLKRSLDDLLKTGGFDEQSDDFVKNVRRGYNSFRGFLCAGSGK